MPRRVSLPGADELFRTTGGVALQSSTPRQHSGADTGPAARERLRPPPGRDGEPGIRDPAGEAADREDGRAGTVRPDDAPAEPDGAADGRPPTRPDDPARSVPPAVEHARPAVPDPAGPSPAAQRAPSQSAVPRRRERRVPPNRRPSGRERHDEKITVYVSAEELMDLEHARLVLRGEHGLAVDRGRIVREAVAVVLADLESRGEASILVRRLRGR